MWITNCEWGTGAGGWRGVLLGLGGGGVCVYVYFLGVLPRSLSLRCVVVLPIGHLVFSKRLLFSLAVLNRWAPCWSKEESWELFGVFWLGVGCEPPWLG